MIVDEIDAFPYHADQMLQYAVRQAMKEKAARIYLTATLMKSGSVISEEGNKRYHCFGKIPSSPVTSSSI